MKVKITALCDGKGYWSSRPLRRVRVSELSVPYIDDDQSFGELRATFDLGWSVEDDGLIYTDVLWLKDFRLGLKSYGFTQEAVDDVEYSEQGMQGQDYVSMDVGKKFLKEWMSISNQT